GGHDAPAPGPTGGPGAPAGGPPAHGGYGAPPPGYGGPQGGYGGTHGGYGGAQGGYGGPQGGPASPPQGPGDRVAPAGPGLVDLSFAAALAARIAELGMIALGVVGGLIAVSGLVGFITTAISGSAYGFTGTMVVNSFMDLLVAQATGLVLVVLGRLG